MPGFFETGDGWLAARVLFLVPVVLSLTVHEFAHAWTAAKLGDDTAAREGRLTLNPLEHIDPVGLLLPLLGVPFGWAKPVPINPGKLSRSVSMETGLVLTASAGPLSNILLAITATCAMALWTRFDPAAPTTASGVWAMLETLVYLNLLLAFFNLLPIPPLDGSRIADSLMPDTLRPAWDAIASLGPTALIAVILVPAFLGFSLFEAPLALAQSMLDAIFALLSP